MIIKKEIIKSQRSLIKLKESAKNLTIKAKFGPSKITNIPLILNEPMAFFVATVIGDGHLKKSKYQINIELADKILLKNIQKICWQLFNRNFNIKTIKTRKNKKPTCRLGIDSKAVYNLLNLAFSIPSGKKSDIVNVPKMIKNSNHSIKSAFIIGILATEGGKRRRGFGLSTSSKNLWTSLYNLFKELRVDIKKDKWIYKKYNKEYYGLFFKKSELCALIKKCKNQDIKEIFLACKNFK